MNANALATTHTLALTGFVYAMVHAPDDETCSCDLASQPASQRRAVVRQSTRIIEVGGCNVSKP